MPRRVLGLLVAVLTACPLLASAQTATSSIEYYDSDALGDVRVVTDHVGMVVRRHEIMPFGEEWTETPAPNPEVRLFTGKERDYETGLDYFGARYYRADIGRFTTVDPERNIAAALADPQRWNRYAYARNNPLRYIDPDGRRDLGCSFGVGVATPGCEMSRCSDRIVNSSYHSSYTALESANMANWHFSLSHSATVRIVPMLAILAMSKSVPTLCGLGPRSPLQQDQRLILRARTVYVQVDALAFDERNRFVADLGEADFRVLEDGVPQELARVELRRDGGEETRRFGAEASPGVVGGSSAVAPGLTYFLVIDDLHVAPERTGYVRSIAEKFIRQVLRPNDLAAVVITSGGRTELTRDQNALVAMTTRIVGRKPPSPWTSAPGELPLLAAVHQGQAATALDVLADVARRAAEIRDTRKELVLVTEGLQIEVGKRPEEIAYMANRARLAMYVIDPRGVGGAIEDFAQSQMSSTAIFGNDAWSRRMLQNMAVRTGGRLLPAGPDLAASFRTLREENSTYYLITYRSNSNVAGAYHRIEIRVNRPGLTVHSREGYFDDPASATIKDVDPGRLVQEVTPAASLHPKGAGPLRELLATPSDRQTHIILIDTDSLDDKEVRIACALAGEVVDNLDPGDRVVVMPLAADIRTIQPTTDRLATGAAVASILDRPRGGSMTAELRNILSVSEAQAILAGDRKVLDRVTRRLEEDNAARNNRSVTTTPEVWLMHRATDMVQRLGGADKLIGLTKTLIEIPGIGHGRRVVTWVTNRVAWPVGPLERSVSELVEAATSSQTAIVIGTASGDAGGGEASTAVYRRIARGTGGVFFALTGGIDVMAEEILHTTGGRGDRRKDPAGKSELTSIRRAVERPYNESGYIGLVRQYRGGDAEAAIKRFAAFPSDVVANMARPLSSLSELLAAIGLHTEAAVRAPEAAPVNIGIARRAVEALSSRRQGVAVCRQWVIAAAAWSRAEAARVNIEDLGDDAAVLTVLGMLPENRRVPGGNGSGLALPGIDAAELQKAERFYRRALAVDSTLVDARLRLGRVLALQGRNDDAVSELTAVRSSSTDRSATYLACLFLGETLEQMRREDLATEAYECAVSAGSGALTARIALARRLWAGGKVAAGRKVLQEGVKFEAEDDPWIDYILGSSASVQRELTKLRALVRQ